MQEEAQEEIERGNGSHDKSYHTHWWQNESSASAKEEDGVEQYYSGDISSSAA